MIFSIDTHIQKIISGEKTQTRRSSDCLTVGRTYAIQPGRAKPGIQDGRILITAKMPEIVSPYNRISASDAQAEGGYTPEQFEELYREIYPGWLVRFVYIFRFIKRARLVGI